jgi:hypothetical protein
LLLRGGCGLDRSLPAGQDLGWQGRCLPSSEVLFGRRGRQIEE